MHSRDSQSERVVKDYKWRTGIRIYFLKILKVHDFVFFFEMTLAARVKVLPLQPFDPFSDPPSLSQRFKQWKRHFETYFIDFNVANDAQKKALLLYQAGAATQDTFESLPVAEAEPDDYETAVVKLDRYFAPQKNFDFAVFQFRQAKQNGEEAIDQCTTRLRKLAVNCEFDNLEKELKAAIIQNFLSK